MREGLLRVGLEPAETFTGNSTVAVDLWAAHARFLVNLAARFAERSAYSPTQISA
jgi:hypothetical protein